MTSTVRLRPEAGRDLAEAAAWYEEQRPALGQQFLDEIVATFAVISETPSIFSVVHKNIRRALIRRFPFGVYYRIEADEIVVVAVMHASRHPQRWRRRE